MPKTNAIPVAKDVHVQVTEMEQITSCALEDVLENSNDGKRNGDQFVFYHSQVFHKGVSSSFNEINS